MPTVQRAKRSERASSLAVDVDEVQRLSNTSEFDVDKFLVTRRGTAFTVALQTRDKPTVECCSLVHRGSHGLVTLEILEQSVTTHPNCIASVRVKIPTLAPVGVYKLVASGYCDDGRAFEVCMKSPEAVVVLFNPWSAEDDVYLEEEELRMEYVLNTTTRLYVGSLTGMPWNLALYRADSLLAVIYLIDECSELTFEEKRSAVKVSREMSALVNWASNDDKGILQGCWDATGAFEGGRPPTAWRGSGEILSQYYRTGGGCVRFGQCWVFSGVLLTVLRVLGIPSRSVTNFKSAHDTSRNRTLDRYFDENGEEIAYLSSGQDTMWNFHVWNEAWMSRPDLPGGFGGWQAVDATPQELSVQGGSYRTGPASVRAIKEGNSLPYDTNFVLAEVNADIKKYIVEGGVPRLFEVNTSEVGQTISTKSAGSEAREDITHNYKFPEGSGYERKALYVGYHELMEAQREVDFSIPEVKRAFGEDVTFRVLMCSRSGLHRIRGQVTCRATSYTGRILQEVEKLQVDRLIDQGTEEEIEMTVDGSIYCQFPGTKVFLQFDVLLAVHAYTQVFAQVVQVAPPPPEITITAPPSVELGIPAKAYLQFKNPLKKSMENVTLSIESDELLEESVVHNVGSVEPEGELCYSFVIVGQRLGRHHLVVGLESNTVELVAGVLETDVVRKVVKQEPVTEPGLAVQTVYCNLAANRAAHKTNQFKDYELILRRGQPFSLTIVPTTDLPSNTEITTKAVFQMRSTSTKLLVNAFEVDTVTTVHGTAIRMELNTPATAAVGRYLVHLSLEYNGTVYKVHTNITLTLLFNPWCPGDSCHYPQAEDLEEYTLNSSGRIWMGTYKNKYSRPWQFSQFRKASLKVSMDLLNRMPPGHRSDPVLVARHFCAMVNSPNDDGVLMEWSGEYTSGTRPTSWAGSGEILAQYSQTGKPVRYGQSWVFSGVLTTLLRCIGIPSRSVTNFVSAYDVDFNRAVDKFYDEKGAPLHSSDSIRSFHVWNEAWMSRPDLPTGFGGWQVLDATPQVESLDGGGVGPCPVQAVKLGRRMNYDAEYVISEVNADIRYYTVHADGSHTLTAVNTDYVGKDISTKAVGSNERVDITDTYKFPEGSTAERAALLAPQANQVERQLELVLDIPDENDIAEEPTTDRAALLPPQTDEEKQLELQPEVSDENMIADDFGATTGRATLLPPQTDQVEKQLELHLEIPDDIMIGDDFDVTVQVANHSKEKREVVVQIHARAVQSTGAPGQLVKSDEIDLKVDGLQTEEVSMSVLCPNYLRILESGNVINFTVMAMCRDEKLTVLQNEDTRIKTPEVDIALPEGGLKLHDPAAIQASFKNPLGKKLTNGKFFLHGDGIVADASADMGPIGACSVATCNLQTIPVKRTKCQLIVYFTSDQLSDLMGGVEVTVE